MWFTLPLSLFALQREKCDKSVLSDSKTKFLGCETELRQGSDGLSSITSSAGRGFKLRHLLGEMSPSKFWDDPGMICPPAISLSGWGANFLVTLIISESCQKEVARAPDFAFKTFTFGFWYSTLHKSRETRCWRNSTTKSPIRGVIFTNSLRDSAWFTSLSSFLALWVLETNSSSSCKVCGTLLWEELNFRQNDLQQFRTLLSGHK